MIIGGDVDDAGVLWGWGGGGEVEVTYEMSRGIGFYNIIGCVFRERAAVQMIFGGNYESVYIENESVLRP